MELWSKILTVPGMGGGFVMFVITLWVLFLALIMTWIARSPRGHQR